LSIRRTTYLSRRLLIFWAVENPSVSGEDSGAAEAHARALARAAHRVPAAENWRLAPLGGQLRADEIVLPGPAEAPIAAVRERCRFRLAAKAPRSADLQGFLGAMLAAASRRGKVAIDVDPQSFFSGAVRLLSTLNGP
jgi:primosomal protein N' (replication factor Y)